MCVCVCVCVLGGDLGCMCVHLCVCMLVLVRKYESGSFVQGLSSDWDAKGGREGVRLEA